MKNKMFGLLAGGALAIFSVITIGAAKADEEEKQAIENAYPSWHPSGESYVFHSDRYDAIDQVFVVNADGSGLRQLTFGNTANRTAVYSPDGSKIVFQSERDGVREIYVMNADGSDQTRLTVGTEESSHPKWSSDGSQIIFDSHRDHPEAQLANIYIMNADGSNVRRLTTYDEYDSYSSLSPDGTKVLFRRVLPTGGDSQSGRNSEVFIMNLDGSDLQNLSDDPAFDGYPSWSADGQWVLFASKREGTGDNEANLFAVRPDGTDMMRLTETLEGVWQSRQIVSFDGTKIIFNRDYLDGSIEVFTMDVPDEMR